MPKCSLANMAPVRAKPVCTSSAMKTTPLARGPVGERRQEAVGRDDEAALALDRLDDDRGQVLGADLLLDLQDGAARGLGAARGRRRGTGSDSGAR